tara:strand:+ start:1019 stop:1216 length:198 start_codon:yes stop_codon:yes gene_type:complete
MKNNIQKWYKLYDGPWTPCKEEDVFSGNYEFYYTPKDKHPFEIMKLEGKEKKMIYKFLKQKNLLL